MAIWMAGHADASRAVLLPFVVVVCPGRLPVGLMVAGHLYASSTVFARIRPIVDRTTIVIRGRPRFADAAVRIGAQGRQCRR